MITAHTRTKRREVLALQDAFKKLKMPVADFATEVGLSVPTIYAFVSDGRVSLPNAGRIALAIASCQHAGTSRVVDRGYQGREQVRETRRPV